jgi:hypothetical protein
MSGGNQTKHPFEWALEIGIFMLLLLTLIATSCAAYFTKKQWETADDQEKRSLRAYLGIADYKVDRAEGVITFNIANGGQTPARDVRVVRNLVLDPAWKEYAKNFRLC